MTREPIGPSIRVDPDELRALEDNTVGLACLVTVEPGSEAETDRIDHLRTEIKGLYVCDASVFPEALDRPTVITIIGLAKRMCAHILGKPT